MVPELTKTAASLHNNSAAFRSSSETIYLFLKDHIRNWRYMTKCTTLIKIHFGRGKFSVLFGLTTTLNRNMLCNTVLKLHNRTLECLPVLEGSSLKTASPTGAERITSLIAGVGREIVSLRKSKTFTS